MFSPHAWGRTDQTFHRDSFVLLGLCGQATREIGLGIGITSPFTRLPVQIARAAGVVDEVADGRFKLGLGTANVATVLTPLNIPIKRSAARLRDSAVIIRRLLAGEKVDFEGPDDVIRGVKLDFTPRPDIPIYFGTRGAKTLEVVGEIGDGVLVESLFNAQGMPYVFDHLRRGAERSNRSLDEVDVVAWQLVQITDDVPQAIAAQKAWVARSIKVGPPDAMRRIGIDEDVIVGVTEAMDRGDSEEAIRRVTDDAVRCLMIIGNPKQVTDQVAEIFGQGVTTVALLLLGPMATLRETLVRFRREVMPAFRS